MTEQGMKEAIEQVEALGYQKHKVIVVYLPQCHESLAGIIAGRIREKYSRPTFVLTDAEEGVKGSGRSMDSFHMYEEMTKCKELFTKYGGHKLAAGLSMEKEQVELFRKTINQNCNLSEEDFQEKILIDIPLPLSYVTSRQGEEHRDPYRRYHPRLHRNPLQQVRSRVHARRHSGYAQEDQGT